MVIENLSRRRFLQGGVALAGGTFVLGIHGAKSSPGPLPPDADAPTRLDAWIAIDRAGMVTLTVARTEMGQGVRTSMPMLIAEELEVGLDQIHVVQADGDKKYGNQNTDGSTSVRTQWTPLRTAGAMARMMLVAAGAKAMNVPEKECRAENGRVIHDSGKSKGYGELAAAAATMAKPEQVSLKDPKTFKLIGTSPRNLDNSDITHGRALYGQDVVIPNMKYAALERCPVKGGKLTGIDTKAAEQVPGVVKVALIEPSGPPANTFASAVVVADNSWAAFEGRKALKVTWEEGEQATRGSKQVVADLEKSVESKGQAFREEGKPYEVLEGHKNVVSARYHQPYLVHAPMEPMAVTAHVTADKCEIWAPSQAPQWARAEAAKALGMDEAKVTIHVTLLGGGFGRKSKPDQIVEAALAAKAAGVPIKLVWKREDEIRFGYYYPESLQKLEAALDDKGMPEAWVHRSVFPTIQSTFNPAAASVADWEMGMAAVNVPFRIPNLCVEGKTVPSPVRIGWMRAVHNTFHSWSVNCFVDELAAKAGRDPIDYHLALLGEDRILELNERDKQQPYKFDTGRLRHVIELVRGQVGLGQGNAGRSGSGFRRPIQLLQLYRHGGRGGRCGQRRAGHPV